MVGLGVGASVSPALFIAGFSLRSAQIQRVFALIELLRGVAAFLAAPLLLHLAMTVASKPAAGAATAIWVCFGIAAAGGLLAVCLFVLGGVRLQRPDLERWGRGEEPAWESPALAASIRRAPRGLRQAPRHGPTDAPSAGSLDRRPLSGESRQTRFGGESRRTPVSGTPSGASGRRP
jgi:hypothetical protein